MFTYILILEVNLHQIMLECSGVNFAVPSVHIKSSQFSTEW